MPPLDRRLFLAGLAASPLLFAPAVAFAQTVNVQELHAPGELGEKVLGPADAKVTVVEYASMSCPHCAQFDRDVFDEFRLKYVDSGKVRYIFREFPLNAPAYAASMVARCAPADRYFDVVHAYFRVQDTWLSSPDLKAATLDIAKPFGLNDKSFEACISNQALFQGLEGVKNRGVSFGVQATPTFFINGKKLEGSPSLAELDKEIEPLL
ncbi:MAG: DsbA family protein [Rhizobiales bacterium]|nr:DsbA family protein [Hyphomicrobiales bacterium]